MLETKSLQLYEANEALQRLNESLERTVEQRTSDLRKALDNVKVSQAESEHLALHDPLTSLPNRRFLQSHLDEIFEEAGRTGTSVAVLHVDLDRFKQINDTLGHAAGDHVLKEAACILRDLARPPNLVARIGGDEFVVIVPFDSDPEGVAQLAEMITQRMSRPVEFEGHALRFGASVGVSYDRADRTEPGKLLVNADIALYRAKGCGRGTTAIFTSELEVEMSRKKKLADEILEGLEKKLFFPYYQPRFCARTLSVEGVEALARWRHPSGHILEPTEFIGIAEDIGVISSIDDTILEQALQDLASWQTAGMDIPRISVNVSFRRLMDPNLFQRLDSLNLPKDKVSFEVVETIFLDDADESTIRRINALKERGIRIEIDDFGSGHASIVGLINLRPNTLKIDRRLIEHVVTDPAQERLVGAIVEIGRSLDLHVIAEGVETDAHAEVCTRLGCDALQGFGFVSPLPKRELERYLLTCRHHVAN